jgi:transcriptional regulator with PAS, ATPase and Fis domain
MAELQAIKNRFGIIGNSPVLNFALDTAIQVAATDLTVLIVGESGVGKEAFSQIIHSLSTRKHNPFIAVNCGAIPEGTIDSELFGHEKGSFTGAVDSRKGYFETVNGGTIFLDEIGEMPLGTQARLLRVLESGEYIRVGSSKVQKTNVRVITATNRELLDIAQNGKFRQDLYYRLSTVPIRVPALRDRKEDIQILFRKFVVDFSERYKTSSVTLETGAKELLTNYAFPGNIRELKNLAEQISVLSQSDVLSAQELRKFLPDRQASRLPMLSNGGNQNSDFASERDILYKLFFDMKKDVNELKKMFIEILQNPAMASSIPNLNKESLLNNFDNFGSHTYQENYNNGLQGNNQNSHPVILHNDSNKQHIEIDESLNIIEKETELILKALKKHKGKRKNASKDLGISERTLYRKLKEYDLENL